MKPENWVKNALICSLYTYPTAPNPPTTPRSRTPAKIVPLIAASSPPPSSSAASPSLFSSLSLLGLKFKNLLTLCGAVLGVLGRVCCCDFFVSLNEEHGFRKWKRFGLNPNKEKQKLGLCRGPAAAEKEDRLRHGGRGGAVLVRGMVGILIEGGWNEWR